MALRAELIDDSPLEPLEREYVRKVLGINGRPDSAIYVESEARMELLTPAQCAIARTILYDIDENGIDTTKVLGGNRGMNYDPERDEGKGARDLRRMLYPDANNDPLSSGNMTGQPSMAGRIQQISVGYKVGPQEFE